MKKNLVRVLLIVIVVLFLLPSIYYAGFVIYNSTKSAKDTTAASAPATNKKASTTMLQGKPLANFTPVATIAELKTEELTAGSGEVVQKGDTITADYTGAIAATGNVFQSSLDSGRPFTTGLSGVIKGWQEAIPGMKVGSTRRLYIPAALAYGASSPSADIPANADLVFDVTVHATKR